MHTHISVEFIPSRVSESCKSMTHFPPVTLVKQSQPRLFSLRHDFSANNTLAHVGYISLITHTPPVKIRHNIRHEIQKYERRGGNHEMRRLFFFSLSTYRNPSRDFQFGPTTAGGKKCRPAHSIFSMHCHSTRPSTHHPTTMHPRNASAQGGGKCSTKISGIPNTIGSTRAEARKGIHHLALPRVRTLLPLLLLFSIFPTMAHLNLISPTFPLANFAFFPFVPFLGERKRARHRNRGREGTFSGTVAFREL